jgi:hypothetical protein
MDMETLEGVSVCRRLRTRMYYLMGRDHIDLKEPNPTAQYWCSKTTTVLGPDDFHCNPNLCTENRSCFEPSE